MGARLRSHPSDYLRQHADDPVDWRPWGEEAFAEARRLDRPVLLSVGYASCHWCHVMQHEVFQDPATAARLNETAISVKVDREERPDVDEAYMTAVQIANGFGGWPMTLFLMPDRRPFYAATYVPRERFRETLDGIAHAWTNARDEVEEAAAEFDRVIRSALARPEPHPVPVVGDEEIGAALRAVLEDENPAHGGFGRAPMFPPHGDLELLLTAWEEGLLSEQGQGATVRALLGMARGGIHDVVAGGFHRYSTDEAWKLPHFEKTLYDNALLLASYARADRLAPHPELARARDGIILWLEAEMKREDGLYASALDADSEGEEGTFYTFTLEELGDLAPLFRGTATGNFRDEATGVPTGRNVLHPAPPLKADLAPLAALRAQKPRPHRDGKAVVAWNALAARGLRVAERHDLADRILDALFADADRRGRVGHLAGEPAGGFLDDHAALALAASHGFGFETRARELLALTVERFSENGRLRNVPADAEPLFGRTTTVFDQPVPSPIALLAKAASRLGENPARFLVPYTGWMAAVPGSTGGLWSAAVAARPMRAVRVRRDGHDLVFETPPGSRVELVSDEGDAVRVRLCSGEVCYATMMVPVES